MRLVTFAAAVLAFGWSAESNAGEGRQIPVGTRIKIQTDSETLVGTLGWAKQDDALGIVRIAHYVQSVPQSSIVRVQYSTGKRASLAGVTVGAVALAIPFGAVGFIAGGLSGAMQPPNMDSGGEDNMRNATITMAIVGASLGAWLGGKNLWRKDNWRDARLGPRGTLIAAPTRQGFVVAARLSF